MIDGALRAVAVVATLIVAVAFVLFAVNELSSASRHQQIEVVDSGSPSPATPAAPAPERGPRRAIDDADRALLSPFSGVVASSNRWVSQGIPTLLAMLVYGLGLGFLARYVRSRA